MNSFSTIQHIKTALNEKKVSPEEVVRFYHDRLKKYNPQLNALLEIYDEKELLAHIPSQGALAGIPGLLKNNIAHKGKITSCGSKILSNYHAPYSATVTKRLLHEGALIMGRTNMDEFAMGASGEFSAFGPTKNPWDATRSPGGSSSGSAAAVAAGLALWALGSETGGSVRQPAAFCGLVGLYPTYGRFSRKGLVAFASSTDQVGPLTKTVYDNALVASVISGHDAADSTSLSQPKIDFTKNLNGKLPASCTVGIIRDGLESAGIDPQIKTAFESAIKHLETLGVTTKIIDLPSLKYGISVYFVLSRAEAASNLSRFDGTLYGARKMNAEDSLQDMYLHTRDAGFGNEVKKRILLGNYVLSAGHRDAFYDKAMKVRALITEEFKTAFNDVDFIISPTTTTLPFKLGAESSDPLAMYMGDYFVLPTNIAGLPALSLPCGYSAEGLPIGFQFIGPRLSESLIYQIAYAFEQTTDYHLKYPQGF